MLSQKQKTLAAALSPAVLIPLLILVLHLYPAFAEKYSYPCVFRSFFRVYCPGCGGTHSVYALAGGNILLALRYNPIVPLAALTLLMVWIENVAALFGKRVKIFPGSKAFYLVLSGILILFYIARNFIPALAPV